jgi:hypothetical protein
MPSKLSWNEDLVEVLGSDNSFEPADAYSTEESMDLDNEGLEADGLRYVGSRRLQLWRLLYAPDMLTHRLRLILTI